MAVITYTCECKDNCPEHEKIKKEKENCNGDKFICPRNYEEPVKDEDAKKRAKEIKNEKDEFGRRINRDVRIDGKLVYDFELKDID